MKEWKIQRLLLPELTDSTRRDMAQTREQLAVRTSQSAVRFARQLRNGTYRGVIELPAATPVSIDQTKIRAGEKI